MNVEDGGIPAMFAEVTCAALEVLDNAGKRDQLVAKLQGLWKHGIIPDFADPKRYGTEHEMLAHVFFFNCMGTDEGKGQFSIDGGGNLKLNFNNGKLADQPVYKKVENICRAIGEKMGGRYVPFPLWKGLEPFVQRRAMTVYPLGGCPMGHSSGEGIVNTTGQVFKADAGSDSGVYPGLYVADASIVPGPLAVNPTLTIVAHALQIASSIQ